MAYGSEDAKMEIPALYLLRHSFENVSETRQRSV